MGAPTSFVAGWLCLASLAACLGRSTLGPEPEVRLVADGPLVAADASPLVPSHAANVGAVPQVASLPVIGVVQSPGGGAPGAGDGLVPTGALLQPAPPDGRTADAMAADAVRLSVAHAGFPATRCRLLPPYAALPCGVEEVIVPRAALVSGELRVELCGGVCVTSAPLPTVRYRVGQISDTARDPAVDDGVSSVVSFAGALYFIATNESGRVKLWVYDDGAAAVSQAMLLANATSTDAVSNLHLAGDRLLFSARSEVSDARKLYELRGDGTIRRISNTRGDELASDDPAVIGHDGRYAYVELRDAGGVSRGWRYDPVAGQLQPFFADHLQAVAVVGGRRLFVGTEVGADWGDRKLFREQDSGVLVQVSATAMAGISDEITWRTVLDDRLYFRARHRTWQDRFKVYGYDPATDLLSVVSDTRDDPSADDDPTELVAHAGALFFRARAAAGGSKLFRFLPGEARLEQLTELRGDGALDDDPRHLTVVGDDLYFVADRDVGQARLFRLTGDGSLHLLPASAGAGLDDQPGPMLDYGGRLVFLSTNGAGRRKLFVHEPVTGGVAQVTNTAGDAGDDELGWPVVHAGKLFFVSPTPEGGAKLFVLEELRSVP